MGLIAACSLYVKSFPPSQDTVFCDGRDAPRTSEPEECPRVHYEYEYQRGRA